jgi:hypothetical protein
VRFHQEPSKNIASVKNALDRAATAPKPVKTVAAHLNTNTPMTDIQLQIYSQLKNAILTTPGLVKKLMLSETAVKSNCKKLFDLGLLGKIHGRGFYRVDTPPAE